MNSPDSIQKQFWCDDDRPDTKLLIKGKNALSGAELLSLVISNFGENMDYCLEIARLLLSKNENSLAGVAKMSHNELSHVVTGKTATRIICAYELGKRRNEEVTLAKEKITKSSHAYELFRSKLQDKPYEEFWILLMNRSNKVISMIRVSEGGISGTVVDPKKVFKIALDNYASSIILGHNHPSGNCTPSEADLRITKKLKDAGVMLEVSVLDHIIIAGDSYYSFSDDGAL